MTDQNMEELYHIIREGVIESIFERGWIEQTPEEFLMQAKAEILPKLFEAEIKIDQYDLEDLIFESLGEELGTEYDINIYRLKLFPSETQQEYDV